MSSDFLIRVRRERSNVTPTDLEFGECKFTDLDDRLHIGKHDGTAASFSADDPANPPAQQVTYTPVVPRVLELNNVAIPTAGQVYQLSAVPSDRPCLAVLQIDPGFAADGGHLALVCEPVSAPQSVPVADGAGVCDALSTYYTSPPFYDRQRARLIIPTASGQIYLARAGNYLTTSSQTKLWTLGYWEGVEIN